MSEITPSLRITDEQGLLDESPDRALVPPIRSLSVREPIHFPSQTNILESAGDNTHNSHKITPTRPDPTQTITNAIEHLEELLEQVGQLADIVNPPSATATPNPGVQTSPTSSKRRRPSEDLVSKGTKYLEEAVKSKSKPRHTVRFMEPEPFQSAEQAIQKIPHQIIGYDTAAFHHSAHNKAEGTKSAPAPPVVTGPASGTEFVCIEPRPIDDSGDDVATSPVDTLRRTSSHANLKQEIKDYIRKHAEVPTIECTTSAGQVMRGAGVKDMPGIEKEPSPTTTSSELKPPELDYPKPRRGHTRHFSAMFGTSNRSDSVDMSGDRSTTNFVVDLRRKTHVDILNNRDDFDVHHSCFHQPAARDWPTSRKRFAAIIVCVNAASTGLLIGIYAGEVPAIQYVIADFGHWTILGNAFLYAGLSLTTLTCWPLPLLHGRKPYSLIGLALAFALQIPQGVVVMDWRMPDGVTWRLALLLSRALMGLALGLVNMNTHATLLDVFGASLQSRHPHGELVDPYDVRRHGEGMGMWLGAWSWCSIGPLALGFMLGAFIVDSATVGWGFWVGLIILTFVMLLNLIGPETRKSAFRRTIADMVGASGSFSRVTRGEIKMHVKTVGPIWWGEEVAAGMQLCWLMVKQPGFLILALYSAWVYAQFTLIMMLMGALTSRLYQYRPVWVGLCSLSLGAGSFLSVPFLKASRLSRSRREKFRTDSMTFQQSGFWSSHSIRRLLFNILTPLSAIGFAATTWGPPFPIAVSCIFAALVGYASTLASTECYGLVMEIFDTSDLQPGMSGRPLRKSVIKQSSRKRTNFTCYPRVCAGVAVMQSLAFGLAGGATALGGRMEVRLGIMEASGVVAGILMLLTILLTMVLVRWKSVRVIPSGPRYTDPHDQRSMRWEPIILGNPSGVTRKINVLEAGSQTRFSVIRRRNRVNSGLMRE